MKSWSFENPSLLRSLLVLASALSLGPGAFAQSGTNFITSNHALKVDVDLVTLSFSVKDKNRRYVGNLSKEDVVLFLCRSGVRSRHAARVATELGYTNAFDILEGFEGDRDGEGHRKTVGGWCKAGLPWVGA